MAKIVYNDINDDAPFVTVHGHTLHDGESVQTDDIAFIKMAEANPWFEVTGGGDETDEPDTPFNRGAAWAREDKKRSVPPAYRGKSEADDWLAGFDSVKPQD